MAGMPVPSCSSHWYFQNHHASNRYIDATKTSLAFEESQPKENFESKPKNVSCIRTRTRRGFKNLCVEGRLKEALEILYRENQHCMPVDYEVYACLLQACASCNAFAEGRQLHSRFLTSGLKQNLFIGTKLVNMYINCRSVEDARQVFDKMPKRNSFLWNALIRGYATEGLFDEVLELYTQMEGAGMKSNKFTFPFVLQACAGLADLRKGKDIHDCIRTGRLHSDLFVASALVAMYAKCGDLDSARQVFDEMPQRDVVLWNAMISGYSQGGNFEEASKLFHEMVVAGVQPNVATHNAMIAGYAQHGHFEAASDFFNQMQLAGAKPNLVTWNAMIAAYAQNGQGVYTLDLFQQMQFAGVKPDAFTFATVLPVLADSKDIEHVRVFHNYIIKSGLQSDIFVRNALLDVYAKCGNIQNARHVFDRMSRKDVVTWNSMIAGYAQSKHYDKTLEHFIQMQLSGPRPDSFTVASFLPACSHIAALQWGKEIHTFVLRNGFDLTIFVANALVDMYSKCGRLEDARRLFDRIYQKTVVSWNTIITGYGMHGQGEEALDLLSQMRQEGMKPNDVTFTAILTACSHSGLVDEGLEQFHSMGGIYKITPRVEHYACIVDLLGRAGHLDEAHTFIKKMPIEPDIGVWGACLGACRVHKNIELAECVAKHIFELNPEDSGYYVLLSNIYAGAGRWADAVEVRKLMVNKGVKKMPGYSWIEVRHKVHTFLSGDQSHPQSEEIYSTLKGLIEQIKASGYVPDTSFVMHDVEENEKQHMLYGHSEKLAIAFGLINRHPGTPIRITKNLRMCGDCHTAAKFISKKAGQEIIVRDMYRFHHFKGGLCSCGDYW